MTGDHDFQEYNSAADNFLLRGQLVLLLPFFQRNEQSLWTCANFLVIAFCFCLTLTHLRGYIKKHRLQPVTSQTHFYQPLVFEGGLVHVFT